MNLIIGKWCFCPGSVSTLFALLFFCLFLFLGSWQLDRAEYKRLLQNEFLKRQTDTIIDSDQLITVANEKLLWRPVSVTGYFDEGLQILLDNQVVKGQSGYFVYTPFQPINSNFWVLVNRGWIATGHDRTKVPGLVKIQSRIKINGIVKEVPKTGMLLAEASPEKITEEIIRVQSLDLNRLNNVLNKKLLSIIIRLEKDSAHGYVRKWRLPGSGEDTHLGYAFQWFAFATVVLIIYLLMNLKDKRLPQKVNDRKNA